MITTTVETQFEGERIKVKKLDDGDTWMRIEGENGCHIVYLSPAQTSNLIKALETALHTVTGTVEHL